MFLVSVKIDGMACSMCEAHIKDVIRKTVPDAKKLTASHGKGEARFEVETAPEEDSLKAAIDATGYRFLSMTVEQAEKKRRLFRIGRE